jgi:hypothetical protein
LPAFIVVITLDYGHFNWGEINLSVALICISFITGEAEHFFVHLLAIGTSFFENFLFSSCTRFFIGVLMV